MPRHKPSEMPISVILRKDQALWLKKEAEKNERTYSQHIRFIVQAHIDFHSRKKDFSKPAE